MMDHDRNANHTQPAADQPVGGEVDDGVNGRTAASAGYTSRPMNRDAADASIAKLRENIQRVFIGNTDAVDRLICSLLARGHVLIEDVPGVGKTVLATALARSISGSFSRIQLTPDLLPGDVLGVSIYDRDTGDFHFKRGPIFANILLADEINRTTPRTQSALLESMNEATVSIDGRVIPLEKPFMVIATQNPYEFEGTYLLPENQLDRFLMKIALGYPDPSDEARVIELRPAEQPLHEIEHVLTTDEVIQLQHIVDNVRLERSLVEYIVELAGATRAHEDIQVGLSPRGTLALAQAARATAVLAGRDYCIPEDVTANVVAVGEHRMVTRGYQHASDQMLARQILEHVLHSVPVPA